jgi:hypothetical protein
MRGWRIVAIVTLVPRLLFLARVGRAHLLQVILQHVGRDREPGSGSGWSWGWG